MKEEFALLKKKLQSYRNDKHAAGMSAYMRNQFLYFGIHSPKRKEIQTEFFVPKLVTEASQIKEFISLCWAEDEREWKYVALDFGKKYLKKDMENLILYFESLVTDQSWWDTVDCLAANLLGKLLIEKPQLRSKKQREWIESDNFWIQRTAIILQLMYKEKTDFEILKELILRRAGSKEFFIQKAIGWALRQYSKTNSKAVMNFVNKNTLAPLSRKEALRLIVK
ncbi:MAG: DNA alkylation repair protein [Saprospiraceae bacterium]|nr:DNA alkylation repair protein [Saprospiraceae bacterium]